MTRSTLKAANIALLAAFAFCIAYHYGDFTKFKIGPIFPAELAFLLWLGLAAATKTLPPLGAFRPLRWFFLFAAWGFVRFAYDAAKPGPELHEDPRNVLRFFQHALLFVYPTLWMPVGVWLYRQGHAALVLTALATLVGTAIPNLSLQKPINLSLGPLLVLALLYLLDRTYKVTRLSPVQKRVVRAIVAFLALGQLWKMWWVSTIQRTTHLLFALTLLIFPAIRRLKLKGTLTTSGTVAVIFLIGVGATLYSRSNTDGKNLKDSFFAATERVEDTPYEGNPERYQFRSRKFWWSTAVKDWKASPVFGIGFVPEVPSWLEEIMPNTWESVEKNPRLRSTAPVSGPHNSYLTILARMGIVGAVLFALALGLFFASVARALWRSHPLHFSMGLAFVITLNGFAHAVFNVGFEAPHNSVLMWLFAGVLAAWSDLKLNSKVRLK